MRKNNRDSFDEYLSKSEWRVKENANCIYSFGGLNKYVIGKETAKHWKRLYDTIDTQIMEGHDSGSYHIHDLGSFSSYCFGGSLYSLLEKGIRGISNIATSKPAKHLESICSQIANIITIFQNENAGAIAFSSVNVYLAPFIYADALRRRGKSLSNVKEKIEYNSEDLYFIKQAIQNMLFALNSNSRAGSEPAFSNFTLDFKVLEPMKNLQIIHGGERKELLYSDFQDEADIFLNIFVELMLEGDGDGKALPYPIPTFNISKDMNWDKYDNVFELASKTGIPYFGNFLHGSLNEDQVFSMCCRLRLDKRELQNKAGGLFGAGENTGSIGVFTINLPRLGFISKDIFELIKNLDSILDLGFKQLETKRKILEENLKQNLYPALKEYMPRGFSTFFSSFGLVGANEMCLNFFKKGIDTESGVLLTIEIIEHIKTRLSEYQEKSGNLYNLEYTPAESTAYRLALKDKILYPSIITAGTVDNPYYTNSTHLPVSNAWTWAEVFAHQEKLLPLATGGSVYHCYLSEAVDTQIAKEFIKTTLTNYNIPYLSLSPKFSSCSNGCGIIDNKHTKCPECGGELNIFQRITGYIRNIKDFNNGKFQEFTERYQRQI